MITVGQKLPNATLYEFFNEESEGCSLGPNAFEVEKLVAGKKIVIFALPGAFTPTCSESMCLDMLNTTMQLKQKVLMKSGVFL